MWINLFCLEKNDEENYLLQARVELGQAPLKLELALFLFQLSKPNHNSTQLKVIRVEVRHSSHLKPTPHTPTNIKLFNHF